jgi:hypothetical protein
MAKPGTGRKPAGSAAVKTAPTERSVEAFLARVPEPRRADCVALVKLMRGVTRAEPKMWGTSIVGFGSYHYRYASGREGDWLLSGFSPRKQDLTVYVMAGFDRYPELMNRLGQYRTGKSCLYLKRLADVDMAVLRQLVTASVRHMRQAYR